MIFKGFFRSLQTTFRFPEEEEQNLRLSNFETGRGLNIVIYNGGKGPRVKMDIYFLFAHKLKVSG